MKKNARGVVVKNNNGWARFQLSALAVVGFFYSVQTVAASYNYSEIYFPGSTYTAAVKINDSGQIVGNYSDLTGSYGFLLSGGAFSTIDPFDIHRGYASGINNLGQIVGDYIGTVAEVTIC